MGEWQNKMDFKGNKTSDFISKMSQMPKKSFGSPNERSNANIQNLSRHVSKSKTKILKMCGTQNLNFMTNASNFGKMAQIKKNKSSRGKMLRSKGRSNSLSSNQVNPNSLAKLLGRGVVRKNNKFIKNLDGGRD